MFMTAIPLMIEPEFSPETCRTRFPAGRLAHWRLALVRRIRNLAWRALDLETEFELLD